MNQFLTRDLARSGAILFPCHIPRVNNIMAALGQTTLIEESRLTHSNTILKNIMCTLERNKIKYKQLNHIAITPYYVENPQREKPPIIDLLLTLTKPAKLGQVS
jgi:hypothetical protein